MSEFKKMAGTAVLIFFSCLRFSHVSIHFPFAAPSESLEINFKVSSALVEIVRQITIKPRYILAKVLL